MGNLTRIALGIFVSTCLWASLNVPQAKVIWNDIAPDVLRIYPTGAPKSLAQVQQQSDIRFE